MSYNLGLPRQYQNMVFYVPERLTIHVMESGFFFYFTTFSLIWPGEVHFIGIRISTNHPWNWLCGLGKQLSKHFWWALGNGGEHSSGPVGMQHGAPGGRPVCVVLPSCFPWKSVVNVLINHTPCSPQWTDCSPLSLLPAKNPN